MDIPTIDTHGISASFDKLTASHREIGNRTIRQRKAALLRLEKTVIRYRDRFKKAVSDDFGKPAEETDLTEILPLISEIRHIRRNLGHWLAPKSVSTPLPLIGASSRIELRPKGVVLVISPWNYPILLTLSPLAGAIAGGNAVMVKPSEYTPHTSALLSTMLKEIFPESEVCVVCGDAEVAREVLQFPFHHIFFTGSTRVGKLVMKAAAEHLSSVTLELGGKSPVIVDATANIDKAARRIAWGKFLNAGQTCVAPDYVLAHRDIARPMAEAIIKYWESFAEGAHPAYSGMVNDHHRDSRAAMLEDLPEAVELFQPKGNLAQIRSALHPTIVFGSASAHSRLMKEEIFGPILPIHTFDTFDEAISSVNMIDRPLVAYIFSTSKKHIRTLKNETASGAVCINHTLVYLFNPELPFGGVNNSGFGKSHGYFSLREFTYERAIFHQRLPFSVADMLRPPYNGFKRWLIEFSLRYF